jgi:hypothetical protein
MALTHGKNSNGKIKSLGSALGFTPQGRMENHECCDLLMIPVLLSLSLSALKRYIFYFKD